MGLISVLVVCGDLEGESRGVTISRIGILRTTTPSTGNAWTSAPGQTGIGYMNGGSFECKMAQMRFSEAVLAKRKAAERKARGEEETAADRERGLKE